MENNSTIRKLTIGDHQQGLSYQLGQTFNRGRDNELKVVSILLDREFLIETKVEKYNVYATNPSGVTKIWKSFSGQKTMVEFEF